MPSGSCICGALKYSFTQPPLMKATCHCLSCRKLTGSAFATTLMIPDGDFTSTGSPKTLTVEHEVGMKLIVSFCGECGVHCWKTAEGWPGAKIVFAGTLEGLDELEKAKPDAELWTKYRVSWVEPHKAQEVEGFPGTWDRVEGKWVEVAH